MTATDLDHVSFCVLVGDDKMLTVNQLRNMHHAVFAKRNAYWRDAFQREAETQQANNPIAFAWCDIVVHHEDIDGHGVCAGWLHLEGDVAEAIDDNEIAMLCSLGAVESTP